MKIISTFDGMSCVQIVLKNLGIEDYEIYASEIDTHAIRVCKDNFPNTVNIGDVTKVSYRDGKLKTELGDFNVGKVDLFVGGSPCQSLSGLGDGSGLEGKSGLFFHWLRIRDELLKENNKLLWLLENVKPRKKEWKQQLDEAVGEVGILVDAKEFLPIRRPRYFWFNWDYTQHPTRRKHLKDILLSEGENSSNKLTPGRKKWVHGESSNHCFAKGYASIHDQDSNESSQLQCLTARSEGSWNSNYIKRSSGEVTKLSPEEYEGLQGVPLGYTSVVRSSQRYKMLGNGWCIPVVQSILAQGLLS